MKPFTAQHLLIKTLVFGSLVFGLWSAGSRSRACPNCSTAESDSSLFPRATQTRPLAATLWATATPLLLGSLVYFQSRKLVPPPDSQQ